MCKGQGKVGTQSNEVLRSIPLACADESVAVNFLEQLRWGEDKAHQCPRCGSESVYIVMDRKRPAERNEDFRWRCRACGHFHTVRTDSVMEDSRIPLMHWCRAFWRVCSSKKGIAAKQIQRETGLSYKSALFLMHRVRYALADMPDCKLTGIVEVDETYVGGKPRKDGTKHKTGRGTKKTPVAVLVERNGNARARVIPNVTGKTLKAAINEHVEPEARINTDDFRSYRSLTYNWPGGHDVVKHSIGEYSRGSACTNTAESFFALLKRGVFGVFHAVSKKHLHRYVSEFEFRWNTRKDHDGERVAKAVRAAEGKRLMYREPVAV
jgi:transposase-like protein